MSKRIFISHAAADAKLVDAFIDLLKFVNISDEDIFCSSLEGLSIPAGLNFVDFIKSEISEPDAVIVFLSKNYYIRPFCLSELGAAWVLSHRLFPLLVNPLTYDDVKDVLTGVQVTDIANPDAISSMAQELGKHLNLKEINIARWNPKLKDFQDKLEGILKALPKPDIPTRKEIADLHKFKTDSIEALKENEDKIIELEKYISKLEALKDNEEVLEVKKTLLGGVDQFEQELDNLKETLQLNPNIVNYAIFASLNGDYISSRYVVDTQIFNSEVKNAVEEKLLEEDSENHTYFLNQDDRKIKKSLFQIESFQEFFDSLSFEVVEALSDKFDFDIDITNKKFWTEVLKFSFYGY